MSASQRLRAKLEMAYPVVAADVVADLGRASACASSIPMYLTIWHGIVRSAVPLIEAARDRALPCLRRTTRSPRGSCPYFEHHGARGGRPRRLAARGPRGARRRSPTRRWNRIPSPRVAKLVGAQYYWLRHAHPVSLLGHMGVVEGYSPPDGFADRLMERTGYPRDAFRAIRRHERLDIKHKRELYELIDELPLTRRAREAHGHRRAAHDAGRGRGVRRGARRRCAGAREVMSAA